jgi:hypothetical protein
VGGIFNTWKSPSVVVGTSEDSRCFAEKCVCVDSTPGQKGPWGRVISDGLFNHSFAIYKQTQHMANPVTLSPHRCFLASITQSPWSHSMVINDLGRSTTWIISSHPGTMTVSLYNTSLRCFEFDVRVNLRLVWTGTWSFEEFLGHTFPPTDRSNYRIWKDIRKFRHS